MLNKIKGFLKRPVFITPDFKTNVNVLIIGEADSKLLWEAFGITKNRAVELYNVVTAVLEKHPMLHLAIEEASQTAKHPNELALMSYDIGKRMGERIRVAEILKAF